LQFLSGSLRAAQIGFQRKKGKFRNCCDLFLLTCCWVSVIPLFYYGFMFSMFLMKLFFWALIGILFYTYLGYGVIVWMLVKLGRRKRSVIHREEERELLTVAHVIAAYNEEDVIAGKIENSLAIDYPRHLQRIIIVADGSSDKTTEIIRRYPQVELFFEPERKGKVAALNRVVSRVSESDIVVFSDANSLLNPVAFSLIMRHYTDPHIGGVSGEKRVITSGKLLGQGEGLYWRYESALKKLDSDFHSVVGAAGELFSIRRELFMKMPEDLILDDFYMSLNVCRMGWIVQYEPRAIAMESPSFSPADEMRRKIRISAGVFQSMVLMKDLLNISRYGKLAFQYVSRRVLRSAICPFVIPVILFLNIAIIVRSGEYYAIFFGQIFFYLLAFIGWLFSSSSRIVPMIFYAPYYFVFMNLSAWMGLHRYLNGTQSAIWEKAKRERLP